MNRDGPLNKVPKKEKALSLLHSAQPFEKRPNELRSSRSRRVCRGNEEPVKISASARDLKASSRGRERASSELDLLW